MKIMHIKVKNFASIDFSQAPSSIVLIGSNSDDKPSNGAGKTSMVVQELYRLQRLMDALYCPQEIVYPNKNWE